MTTVQDHQAPRCLDGSCTGNRHFGRTASCGPSIVQQMFLQPPPPMQLLLLPPLRHGCDGRGELRCPDSVKLESICACMVYENSVALPLSCQMWISVMNMGNEISPLKSGPSACSSRSTHREVYSFTDALSNLPIASAASVLQETAEFIVPGLQSIIELPRTRQARNTASSARFASAQPYLLCSSALIKLPSKTTCMTEVAYCELVARDQTVR